MENETKPVSSSASSNNKMLPVIAVILLVIVVAGGYYFYHKHKEAQQQAMVMAANQQVHPQKMGKMNPDMMKATTPAPLTAQQQEELTTGTSSATTEKTFDISAGNFWFTPNKMTVNKGDKVTIVFAPQNGFHDFVIDEFNVKAGPILTGKTVSVTFTADKTGTFQFYCSIDHHRQKGQVGTLTVQ